MRAVFRFMNVVLLGAFTAALLASSLVFVSAVAVAAKVVLAMGGTGGSLSVPPDSQSMVDGYTGAVTNTYIDCDPSDCTVVGAVTPEEFWPVAGQLTFDRSVALGRQQLDDCISGAACIHTRTFPLSGTTTGPLPAEIYEVFGFSQSATIVTLEKRHLAETHAEGEGPDAVFHVIGNPNRPNGGFLARFIDGFTIPILNVTFFGPTPTDTQYQTADYTRQFDGWSDNPTNPLLLARNLLRAIPTGFDDALSQAAGDLEFRPFGTGPAGPYGVGGPAVTISPATTDENQQSATSDVDDPQTSAAGLSVTANATSTAPGSAAPPAPESDENAADPAKEDDNQIESRSAATSDGDTDQAADSEAERQDAASEALVAGDPDDGADKLSLADLDASASGQTDADQVPHQRAVSPSRPKVRNSIAAKPLSSLRDRTPPITGTNKNLDATESVEEPETAGAQGVASTETDGDPVITKTNESDTNKAA